MTYTVDQACLKLLKAHCIWSRSSEDSAPNSMLDAFKWSHLHRVKPLGLNVKQTTCHRLLLQLLANHLISLIHPPGCFFLLSVISI